MAWSRQETMQQPRQRKNKGRRKAADSTVINDRKEKRTGRGTTKGNDDSSQKKSKTIFGLSNVHIVVLVVAFAIGVFWYSRREPEEVVDEKIYKFLTTFISKEPGGYQHGALVPTRRTQKAKRKIRPYEPIAYIPRNLQIWDLDALRDEFVEEQLMRARHAETGNPLDGGAFLAAYVARRYYIAKITGNDEPMLPYFEILPTYDDLAEFHPLFWTQEELKTLLGSHSMSYELVIAYRDMIESEYEAFVKNSPLLFANQVSAKDYKTMRINVISRTFGTGLLGDSEELRDLSFEKETQFYEKWSGVDTFVTMGCRAMVPMLDSYNHHARSNVNWRYSKEMRAFRVYAGREGVAPGQELIDSYGTYTDHHLFARFGFNNGDGSEYTQASIAVLHRLLDVGLKPQFSYLPLNGTSDRLEAQKQELIRYLSYDDGYSECITARTHPEPYKIKRLKFDYLVKIANTLRFWIVSESPRNMDSRPAVATNVPITTTVPVLDPQNFKNDLNRLLATCRMISITAIDVGPEFVFEIRKMLEETTDSNEVKMLGRQTDESEYRANGCLARLAAIALDDYPRTVEEEMELVAVLNREAFQSRNWTAAHVRLGEMQTLQAIRETAIGNMRELASTIRQERGWDESTAVDAMHQPMHIRKKACPEDLTLLLS